MCLGFFQIFLDLGGIAVNIANGDIDLGQSDSKVAHD
jgi:hypothetical protein